MPSDFLYWLAALHLSGIGPVKLRRWLTHIPHIQQLFLASEKELEQVGLSVKEIQQIKSPDWESVNKELRWCEESGCHIVTISDPDYPPLLREIHDPPLVLFVIGDKNCLAKPQIAIVGTRNPTTSACESAHSFAQQLASLGLIVTSGMALGIDAASHKGAMTVGETIAVMGAGLATIYPASHRRLAETIKSRGALVSEFSPFVLPKAKNFPLRNRVISGLSMGVLVVEAAVKSGSLITARIAIEQGREVFAIPGSIYNPQVRGCHYLIRNGAKLVETVADVIEELGALLGVLQPKAALAPTSSNCIDLAGNMQQLFDKIGFETTSLDTIIVRSGLTASKVSSILLSLELEGYVQTVPGGYARTIRKTV